MTPFGQGTNVASAWSRGGSRRIGGITAASQVSYGRALDGISTCEITVPVANADRKCRNLLENIHAWGHEIVMHRDGERAWEGPITRIVEKRGEIKITARDVLGYTLRRVTRGRNTAVLPGMPVCYVVDEIEFDVLAAFSEDDPNVLDHLTLLDAGAGPATQREVGPYTAYYADTIDSLSNSGGNYTVVGRRILVWSDDASPGRLKTLLPETHLTSDIEVSEEGMAGSTRVIATSDESAFGASTANGVDSFYGVVETLVNIPGLITQGAAPGSTAFITAADSIRSQTFPMPQMLNIPEGSTLSGEAPYTLAQLVPGVTIPVSHRSGLRKIDGDFILTAMQVVQDASGEQVQISVTPSIAVNTDEA